MGKKDSFSNLRPQHLINSLRFSYEDVLFDERGGGVACLHFWFKSSNFLAASLIRKLFPKIKLETNDL